MPENLLVRAMGVVIAVEAPDAETLERWQRQWQRAVVDAPAEYVVDASPLRDQDGDGLDYRLTSLVTMAAAQATEGVRVNFHAAGFADDEGRALALVAPSGTGKTTASRAIGRRLAYLSDETVSIGPDLTVAPHPKPLSIRLDGPDPKEQLPPDEAGLLPTPESARLTRLVLLDRGGDGERGLTRLDDLSAIVRLVTETSALAVLPNALARLHEIFRATGGCWLLTYDEIEDHVDELIEFLTAEHDVVDEIEHIPSGSVEAGGPDTWRRVDWHDALTDGAASAVMVGSHVYLLEGLGHVLWGLADTPAAEAELVTGAQDVLGEHPEAEALVRQALAQLAGEGLLVRD